MSAPDVKFVDELPPDRRGGAGANQGFWDALRANPGKWAVWPGSSKSSAYQLAQAHSRNGEVFEGSRRGDTQYLRLRP